MCPREQKCINLSNIPMFCCRLRIPPVKYTKLPEQGIVCGLVDLLPISGKVRFFVAWLIIKGGYSSPFEVELVIIHTYVPN